MANLIIPAASAGVGYLVGGSTGAQIGWMLGSALQASNQKIEQPSTMNLIDQTAKYGAPIPLVVGKQRVGGNIIWTSAKKKYSINTKTGKGGGPTVVTTGYKQDICILICKGPIVGITRVWANNALIIDGTTAQKHLIGNLYLGSSTQVPDGTMESALGVGNVPAYRDLAYIVLPDFDLGVSGAIPSFSFEVLGSQGF
jgi:hypothetical protein